MIIRINVFSELLLSYSVFVVALGKEFAEASGSICCGIFYIQCLIMKLGRPFPWKSKCTRKLGSRVNVHF